MAGGRRILARMKLLLKLALLPILLFVLLILGVAVLLDPAAVKAVSGGVSAATGCDASLGSADIGLLDGHVRFGELEVQNPPGFREGPLLELGTFDAQWDTASLFGDEVRVNGLELDGLRLALELKGGETNLAPILDKLRELSAKSSDSPAEPSDEGPAPEGDSEGGGKKVHIDQIRIAGVRAELHVSDLPGVDGQYAVDVPEFVIEDLGNGEKSATLTEWSARVLEVVLEEARAAGEGTFPGEWQALLAGGLEGLGDQAVERLEGEAKKWLEENASELPEEVQQGLDALGEHGKELEGLFGGKQ